MKVFIVVDQDSGGIEAVYSEKATAVAYAEGLTPLYDFQVEEHEVDA